MGDVGLTTMAILPKMSGIGKLKCPLDKDYFLWLEVMKFLGKTRDRDNLLLWWDRRLRGWSKKMPTRLLQQRCNNTLI
jgi:hypothetical protein